jgi:hypothetical protein
VRFRETCLSVVVVIARVRDEVLYTIFAAPSTPLRSCQTLVLANVRQATRPLRCPLADTLLVAAAWPLVGIREDPVEDPRLRFTPPPLRPSPALIVVSLFSAISPARARIQLRHRFAFRFSSIPGARGRLLLGPSPALIVASVSTPPLHFFSRKLLRLSIRKEERDRIWDGGGSSQCRRRLANPSRFVVCMKKELV